MTKGAIYKEILREYDRLRTEEKAALEARKALAFRQVPRIEEIEKELSLTGVKTARLALQGGDSARLLETLKDEVSFLKREREYLLKKNGFPPDFLKRRYQCMDCHDTGYIEGEKCRCLLQRFIEIAYGQSNLKELLERENFDFFDLRYYSGTVDPREGISPQENIRDILRVCMAFAQEFGNRYENLMLYGGTGLGKTFLCNCIAKEVLDKGYTVLYFTAGQLFKMAEDARFGRNDEDTPPSYMEEVLSVDLFIIDDIGTEFSTILSSSELFHILNTRMLCRRPVILSTNLKPEDLVAQYSDRLVSRLTGEYTILKFFGEDIRKQKKFRH